jgi:hypothetical protein
MHPKRKIIVSLMSPMCDQLWDLSNRRPGLGAMVKHIRF